MVEKLKRKGTRKAQQVQWLDRKMAMEFSNLIPLLSVMKVQADQDPMHVLAASVQKILQPQRGQLSAGGH